MVVLDAGATSDLARFRSSGNHHQLSGKRGLFRASTHPACARFKFGDGRLVAALLAADITVGIAG